MTTPPYAVTLLRFPRPTRCRNSCMLNIESFLGRLSGVSLGFKSDEMFPPFAPSQKDLLVIRWGGHRRSSCYFNSKLQAIGIILQT